MKKARILFEAGPMVDSKKTGVGYYTSSLFSTLGVVNDPKFELTGYYFNFLSKNNKQPPALPHVGFHKIWLIPGKLLSVCRRLGFQPYIEFFMAKRVDLFFFTNYVSLPTLRQAKKALVIYDLSFLDCAEYTQEKNLEFLQNFCPPSIRNADILVTISEFTKQRLMHHFPDLKSDIVITPIPPLELGDESTALSDKLKKLGVSPAKYILYLGTIEPRKNILNLVRAYALLPAAVQNEYALVLAGGNGWKNEATLVEIANLRAKGIKIITTGYITEQEKGALYTHATCFVLPSHYEGFGMPILEAMQYKLPVTVSDIPVFHEVAGDAASYFDKDSPSAIAKSVLALIQDNELREMLNLKSAEQLKKFSWDANAKLILEAFNKHVA
jgi:glycosyltransferase involved in cell wall biosynthesis